MAQVPYINPQGLDPYPIESVLAQGMMDPAKAGVAAALMAGYNAERGGNARSYLQSVQQAQQLSGQQAAMSGQEKMVGHLINLLKNASDQPGMLEAAAGNNLLSPMMQGNPDAYGGLINSIARSHGAKIMQQTGAGAENLQQAGYAPGVDLIRQLLGSQSIQAVAPLAMRTAAAGGASVPKVNMSYPSDHPGGPTGTFSIREGQDPTPYQNMIRQMQGNAGESNVTRQLATLERRYGSSYVQQLLKSNRGNREAAISEARATGRLSTQE